jgi:SNF2 family DNA or RNA helicase
VKTAGHHLAQAFADGVIVVDEGTLAKGDGSLRSKAVRGLKARHRYLLTGTPISNYVNDAFWLLWWALGNATLRLPFDYEGGRAKFEADFCVIEHFRDDKDGRRKNRKVLPQVTNVSRLWRLLSGAMVRRRKQHMGKLPPRTTRTIAAPMGVSQQELYRFWLSTDNFRRYFEWKFPGHALTEAGLVELFAAGLGQLTKLEYATTLPEADPDREKWAALEGFEHSNWTPKNLKVLQVAMEHVEAGEKVLIGSDLIETGRWLCERLKEKGVRAAHIVEERSGRASTMSPRKRAAAIERFKTGSTQVLCCGIPSIRLGHSLEAASCVIADGLVFSYEMFDQFIARAWRLTSPGPVSVYVALTLGSLDPRKWELLCQKAKAADLALDGQLVDEPEQPISREEFLRELRRQGVKPTGEEIAEADIEAAWRAAPMLAAAAGPRRRASVDREGMTTVDWHKAPVETEQLDLFAAVG